MNWRLTRDARGEPMVEIRDEPLRRRSVIRELALQDASLTELEDGVWYAEKERPGRWA